MGLRPSYRFMRVAMLCVAVVVAPHLAAAQPAAGRLGDSLSDREFWQLFATLSEESGTFPSENFVSNERTYQYVIPTLQRTLTPNGVYLGVGPEQNFTYIVNLKPRLAVIFDIRRQNAMLHLMYKALFELSPTRTEFLSRLFSRPLPSSVGTSATPGEMFDVIGATPSSDSAFAANWRAIVDQLTVTHGFALPDADLVSMQHVFEAFREAGPSISYAYRLGTPPTMTQWLVTFAQLQTATNADSVNMAFLATEEMYRLIRTLQARNLVVPVVGDFAGPKAIRGIGSYLKARGASVSAFYTSNVEQYLFSNFGAEQRFYRNVGALPIDSTSMFIRAVPGGGPTLVGGVVLPNLSNLRLTVQDSAGFRVVTATGVDSTGRLVTSRSITANPPPTAASTSAFVSGIAPIRRALEAFVTGQLSTYQQAIALTKTEGWKN